jgi:hypothetical protein
MNAMFSTSPVVDSMAIRGDAARLRRVAKHQGYLFFRGLIDPEAIAELRRQVLAICQQLEWLAEGAPLQDGMARPDMRLDPHDERWVSFQCQVFVLADFIALGEHPAILDILERLFHGPVLTGRGHTCRLVSPWSQDLTTPPHQDHFYVRGTTRLWTVWIPLGDCPVPLGGLAALPGSHRQGLLPHQGDGAGRPGVAVPEDMIWATADYAAGDVLMFNSVTLHRACPNMTANRLRLSVDYRYEPAQGSMVTARQRGVALNSR